VAVPQDEDAAMRLGSVMTLVKALLMASVNGDGGKVSYLND